MCLTCPECNISYNTLKSFTATNFSSASLDSDVHALCSSNAQLFMPPDMLCYPPIWIFTHAVLSKYSSATFSITIPNFPRLPPISTESPPSFRFQVNQNPRFLIWNVDWMFLRCGSFASCVSLLSSIVSDCLSLVPTPATSSVNARTTSAPLLLVPS